MYPHNQMDIISDWTNIPYEEINDIYDYEEVENIYLESITKVFYKLLVNSLSKEINTTIKITPNDMEQSLSDVNEENNFTDFNITNKTIGSDDVYQLVDKNTNSIVKKIIINRNIHYVNIQCPKSGNNYKLNEEKADSFVNKIDTLWNNTDISYESAVMRIANDYN